MNIVLIAPPTTGLADEYSLSSRENLALGYLAASLREQGHRVSIVNYSILPFTESEFESLLRRMEPDVIGISLAFWDERRSDIQFLNTIRRSASRRTHISLGGYAPSLSPEFFFENAPEDFDSIVIGEGDAIFPNLMTSLAKNGQWKSTKGIAYHEGLTAVRNEPQSLVRDLDSLPYPSRDDLDHLLCQYGNLREIYLSSSRGCFARCSFCSITTFYSSNGGVRWRGRSPENICQEIKSLVNRFRGSSNFAFVDDNFIGPGQRGKERARLFATALRKQKLDIQFEITCRADNVERHLFALLKDSGLRGVYLGIDAGTDKMLRLFRKDISIERNYEAARILNELGIVCDFGFILFEPYSTLGDIEENLIFLEELSRISGQFIHPTSLFHCLTVYPSTEICSSYGYLQDTSVESPDYFLYPEVYYLRRTIKSLWEAELAQTFKEVQEILLEPTASLSEGDRTKFRLWMNSVPMLLISIMKTIIEQLKGSHRGEPLTDRVADASVALKYKKEISFFRESVNGRMSGPLSPIT